jgi:hypothetical protein
LKKYGAVRAFPLICVNDSLGKQASRDEMQQMAVDSAHT